MTRMRGLAFLFVHLVAAMALLPAEGAVVLDASSQACDAPLHARVVQVGAAQVMASTPCIAVFLPPVETLDVAASELRDVRQRVDAGVRVRGPPMAGRA